MDAALRWDSGCTPSGGMALPTFLLGGRQDQRGVGLNALRGVIAPDRLGRDMAHLFGELRTAAGARHVESKVRAAAQ